MKLASLLCLILLVSFLLQDNSTQAPDVVVLKFRCGRYETGSGMIRSVQDPDTGMNEPVRLDQTKGNEPQEVKNRRDMQARRAEMMATEITAQRSSQKNSSVYFYRIQVQNSGTKAVKSIAWEYQPSAEPDSSDRQFFCVINAKPSEKKEFELYSPLAPSRVVDASKPEDKPNAEKKDKIIINKIEYADGSFWKRPAWNPKTFTEEDTSKVGGGKCIGI